MCSISQFFLRSCTWTTAVSMFFSLTFMWKWYFLFVCFTTKTLSLTEHVRSVIEMIIMFTSLFHKCKTPFWFTTRLLLSSRFMPVVKSTTSSWSSWSFSSDVFVLLVCCEPDESWLFRLNEPRRGVASVRWFAGFTVMMRFELFATIISVTFRQEWEKNWAQNECLNSGFVPLEPNERRNYTLPDRAFSHELQFH